jgi:hypothetical protein
MLLFSHISAHAMGEEDEGFVVMHPPASIAGAFAPPALLESEERPGESSVEQKVHSLDDKHKLKLVVLRSVVKTCESPIIELGAEPYYTTLQARNEEREKFLALKQIFSTPEEEINYHIKVVNFTADSGPLCDACHNTSIFFRHHRGGCTCDEMGRDPQRYRDLWKESSAKVAKYYEKSFLFVLSRVTYSEGASDPQELLNYAFLGAQALEKMFYYSGNRARCINLGEGFVDALRTFISQKHCYIKSVISPSEDYRRLWAKSYFKDASLEYPIFQNLFALFNGTAEAWTMTWGEWGLNAIGWYGKKDTL